MKKLNLKGKDNLELSQACDARQACPNSDPGIFNPRSLLEKIVTQSLEGGGINRTPPPSTFDTIHPIDLKFDTYSKFLLYFQLSETMWCLIGFHGNNSQINDVTGGRHLGFSNFQILFKFSLFYLRSTGKQHSAVEIYEIGQIHCKVVSI